jgi:hypothetical protein
MDLSRSCVTAKALRIVYHGLLYLIVATAFHNICSTAHESASVAVTPLAPVRKSLETPIGNVKVSFIEGRVRSRLWPGSEGADLTWFCTVRYSTNKSHSANKIFPSVRVTITYHTLEQAMSSFTDTMTYYIFPRYYICISFIFQFLA